MNVDPKISESKDHRSVLETKFDNGSGSHNTGHSDKMTDEVQTDTFVADKKGENR